MADDTGSGALVVDAANVVGSRPDGWWRDRAGAAERLLTLLASATARASDGPTGSGALTALRQRRVIVVLEGRAVAAAGQGWDGLDVVRAPRDGDGTIVDVVAGLDGADVIVVTSDRELRRRVEELGADVRGAGWLRDALDPRG